MHQLIGVCCIASRNWFSYIPDFVYQKYQKHWIITSCSKDKAEGLELGFIKKCLKKHFIGSPMDLIMFQLKMSHNEGLAEPTIYFGFSSRKILCPDNFETPCAKYSCWSWCSRSYKGQNGYLLSYRALTKILQDDSWLMDNFVTNVWRIVTQDPVVLVVDFISWTWVMNFDCDVMRQIFFPQQVHR